jgi:hypothetical protein
MRKDTGNRRSKIQAEILPQTHNTQTHNIRPTSSRATGSQINTISNHINHRLGNTHRTISRGQLQHKLQLWH